MNQGRVSHRLLRIAAVLLAVASAAPSWAAAASALGAEAAAEIDAAVAEVLETTGAPSASVAVVLDGDIAFTRAYGTARLDPATPAATSMRYPVGSISKQFTAAAVVLLAAEGKLDLDAPVAAFFPDITRADEITLRHLLSHTSGIRDYWPQDYVPPAMLEPIEPTDLIAEWASRPLDFDPGAQFQYSNTGYVIAGAIVERVAGTPLFEFLRERIFGPLAMTTVVDIDGVGLPDGDAAGYQRFALGPPRPAPDEGRGWLFAAGSLAMTAEDLARWDVAWIRGTGPGKAVFDDLAVEVRLATGVGVGYGLGVGLALDGPRRVIGHGGEVSGFTAINRVYPEDRAAVVVLVNQDAVHATRPIADRIAEVLFAGATEGDASMHDRVSEILDGLRTGRIDPAVLTPNARAYFTDQALADIRSSLRGLGRLKSVEQVSRSLRGGLTTRVYHATFRKATLAVVTRTADDGRLEQLTLAAE